METTRTQGSLVARVLAGAGPAGLILAALIPLLLLGVVLALVVVTGSGLTAAPPAPIENLTIERIVLGDDGFDVAVMNSGPTDLTLAQVLVDDAVWLASLEGSPTLPRLGRATIHISYPWVEGDRHEIKLITTNGLIFTGEVEVATASPQPSAPQFLSFALLGFYVGIVPVGLGLLWFPFLRRLGRSGMRFILSLTVGLLFFLVVDTLLEAIEVAGRLPGIMQGVPLVAFVTLLSFMGLVAIGQRRGGAPSRLQIAYSIALGIGLHNLGEGLAIGAAFALGNAALGAFLVIGFTLHNITEGIGIGAPVASERPAVAHFVRLALLAGGPAIIGTWIGGFVYSDLAAALFLSLGSGAIIQVMYEVTRLIGRQEGSESKPLFSAAAIAGLTAGIAIMYLTGVLVKF